MDKDQEDFKVENTILWRLAKIAFFLVAFYSLLLYIQRNLSIEKSNIILEYLRVLAWPLMVLFLAVVFKENIRDIIFKIQLSIPISQLSSYLPCLPVA